MDVLFLDTEGFSVSNVTESYDARVFAATTLLSSQLLYSSFGILHAGELEYMDLLLHNTQLFAVKTAMKQEEEEALGECVYIYICVCVCVCVWNVVDILPSAQQQITIKS